MRSRHPALITLSVVLLSCALHAQWMTGFYESQNGIEPVASIPWSKYTHVVHFLATVDVDDSGTGTASLRRLSPGEATEVAQLIASRPAGKKVLLCIRDNGRHPNAMSQSTAPARIATFVSNISKFVLSHGYDGVDIDWEFNVNAAQYIQLLHDLRVALPDKLITVDMGRGQGRETVANTSQSYVNEFNIMCYDLDTPGNGFSWYNTPLFQSGNRHVMTCDWEVEPFLRAGVAPSKIGIGLPFYGRRWQGVTNALENGTFSATTVFYSQLVTDKARWRPQYQFYDDHYKSNYLSIPKIHEFDSYTGPQAIRDAVSWIKSKGFGGVMTFSLHYEYLPGQTGDTRYPLSTALHDALFSAQSAEKAAASNRPRAK